MELLTEARADVNMLTNKPIDVGMTPLFRTGLTDHDACIECLLSAGSDIKATMNINGFSPLHYFCTSPTS